MPIKLERNYTTYFSIVMKFPRIVTEIIEKYKYRKEKKKIIGAIMREICIPHIMEIISNEF